MESEGFTPQGLMAPKLRHPPTRFDAAKSAIYSASQLEKEKPDGEKRTINALQTVKNVTWGLWFVQFVAIALIPIASLIGWMGWKSGAASVRSFVSAPVRALMGTPVNEVGELLTNSARHRADLSRLKGAPERATAIEAKLDQRLAGAATKPKLAVEPKASWLDKLSKDHWFSKRLQRFTEGRVNKHGPKVNKAIETAQGPITKILEGGQASSDRFKPVHDLLERAKTAATPAEKAGLLHQAEQEAHRVSQGLVGGEADAAQKIRDGIRVARRSADYLVGHVEALGKGARGQFQNIMRIGGRVPVFYAILAAGLAVGTVGAALNTRRENRLAREAVQQMKDDIGDEHHPMVQEAEKIAKTQRGRRWLGAGLSVVGDGAILVPINGFAGTAAVMGASQLPMLGQNLMPQNQPLSAYTMLKKAETGKIQLQPKQKVELLTHLVTAVPAFAKQGGMDNKLVAPVAVEIAKRDMNVRDTMRFLANPDQFMEVVKTAAAEQKKLDDAAAAEKAAEKTAEKTTNEKTDASKTGIEKTEKAAAAAEDKPSATISAAKGTAQGRVADMSRAVGQA